MQQSMTSFDVSVLCVEDEPISLEFMVEMLRPHVREISTARDGQQGYFEFARTRPDIVLTDMEMPKMDGLEMSQGIRALSPSTPIILVTGLDDPRILKRGIQLKADGFLSKPISPDSLLGVMERCVDTILFQREAKSHRKLRDLILNSLPFPMALINTTTFQVLFSNSQAQRLGIEPDRPMYEAFFSEEVQRRITQPRSLAEKLNHSEVPPEVTFAGKTWEINLNTVAAETILFVAVDITARKKLDELKNDVDRITRHDLKAPLGAIIGLPDMLLQQEDLPEEISDSLNMIREAGHNMLSMINLSLDLFKMEQGTYQFQPSPVDVVTLINEILPQVHQLIRFKQIQVRMLLNDAPVEAKDHFMILGEKLLCLSMFSNLLKNAAEAAPDQTAITIRLSSGPDQARIAIHNQGTVPAPIRPRFFEKYVTMNKKHGTGLGAYSAALIARTQGGDIQMHTTEDEGTTITVRLSAPQNEPGD